jgi:hypothetical protein
MKITSIIISLVFSFSAFASLFSSDDALDLRLEYDITRLQKEKHQLREVGLSGILVDQKNDTRSEVEILSRGGASFECTQPQIKIKFSKDDPSPVFRGSGKVKLFTSGICLLTITDSNLDKTVLSNYLLYKLLEEVTALSFKTRLAKITYKDQSGQIPEYIQFAFFLETDKNFAKRTLLEEVKEFSHWTYPNFSHDLFQKDILRQINSFQFFIGNVDYGVPGFYSPIINRDAHHGTNNIPKNLKLFKDKGGALFPVIYDFDLSRFRFAKEGCAFGRSFFSRSFEVGSCEMSSILTMLQDDLDNFKYKEDVKKHKKVIVKIFNKWRDKNKVLINILGEEYLTALDNFIKAYKHI